VTSFHDVLRSSAERYGDCCAILVGDEHLTYGQLLSKSEALAASLAAHGINAESRIALIMDNSMECVLAWLATTLTGATDIPINPQYRGELLHYLLSDSGATTVVCDQHYLPALMELVSRLPSLREIFVNGEVPSGAMSAPRIHPFLCVDKDTPFSPPAQSNERLILYTSGTTGPSKGVVHSQQSMLMLSRYNAEIMGYGPDDRLLNFFPLFHQNARYTGVMPALCTGASIRIEPKLSTTRFWDICDHDRVTAFNYLGSVLRMILNATGPERRIGTHSITRAFGAGASPAVWTEFEDRLGIALYETYGLSEAPMAAINVPGPDRAPLGSAGKPSALFEVQVFDDDDRALPPGETGEFVLRPRQPGIFMQGYHGKPEATAEATRNLWFHSGDRGHMSVEGNLYFEERSKDSIRRRGENISAWEVETTIERHPAVAEAAVYGLKTADGDEEVAASIVPSGPVADLASIHAFAIEHLPSYAVPMFLRTADDLPRTPTAKVRKEELRALPRDAYTFFPPR
jgi:carnitine-CoA ligase